MEIKDIETCYEIWNGNFKIEYHYVTSAPNSWLNFPQSLKKSFQEHCENRQSLIFKENDQILGYVFYDKFPFHGEKTIIYPVVGHAAQKAHKQKV